MIEEIDWWLSEARQGKNQKSVRAQNFMNENKLFDVFLLLWDDCDTPRTETV